jgi:hypothetical protein
MPSLKYQGCDSVDSGQVEAITSSTVVEHKTTDFEIKGSDPSYAGHQMKVAEKVLLCRPATVAQW